MSAASNDVVKLRKDFDSLRNHDKDLAKNPSRHVLHKSRYTFEEFHQKCHWCPENLEDYFYDPELNSYYKVF